MRVQVLVHLLWLLNLDSLFSTGLCRGNSHALVQLSSAMSFNQIAALGRLLTASAQHSCCASCLYQCTYCSPGFCPASMSKPKQSSGLQHQGGATSDRLVCNAGGQGCFASVHLKGYCREHSLHWQGHASAEAICWQQETGRCRHLPCLYS